MDIRTKDLCRIEKNYVETIPSVNLYSHTARINNDYIETILNKVLCLSS